SISITPPCSAPALPLPPRTPRRTPPPVGQVRLLRHSVGQLWARACREGRLLSTSSKVPAPDLAPGSPPPCNPSPGRTLPRLPRGSLTARPRPGVRRRRRRWALRGL